MAKGGISLLHCGICMEDMTSRCPRALPCLHTFCSPCLESLYQKNAQFVCPTCRKQPTLPSAGIVGLPENFLLKQFDDHVRTTDKECDSCGKSDPNKVGYRCLDCDIKLCEECMKSHLKTTLWFTHKVVPLLVQEDQDHGRSKICTTHRSKCVYYCHKCESFICFKCVSSSPHSDHQVYIEPKHKNAEYGQQIEAKLRKVYEIAEAKLVGIEAFKENKVLIETEIDEYVSSVQDMLRKKRNDVQASLDKELDHILSFRDELAKQFSTLKQISTNKNTDKGSQIELVLSIINKMNNDNFRLFTLDRFDLEKLVGLGSLSSSEINTSNIADTSIRKIFDKFHWSVVKGKAWDKLDGILKSAKHHEHLSNEVKTKSELNPPVADRKLTSGMGFFFPGTVIALPSGGVVVSNTKSPAVTFLDGDGNVMVQFLQKEQSGGVRDVALYKSVLNILKDNFIFHIEFHAKHAVSIDQRKIQKNNVVSIAEFGETAVCFGLEKDIYLLDFTCVEDVKVLGHCSKNIKSIRSFRQNETLMLGVMCIDQRYFQLFNSSGDGLLSFDWSVSLSFTSEATMSHFGTAYAALEKHSEIREYSIGDNRSCKDIKVDCGTGAQSLSYNFPYIWIRHNDTLHRYKMFKDLCNLLFSDQSTFLVAVYLYKSKAVAKIVHFYGIL